MYKKYISYSLLVTSGIFLLCTVFATDNSLANGMVTGKVHWFHLAMLFLAVCSLVAAVLTRPTKRFAFSVTDGMVLALAAIVAFTYNWGARSGTGENAVRRTTGPIVVPAAVHVFRMAATTIGFPDRDRCYRTGRSGFGHATVTRPGRV